MKKVKSAKRKKSGKGGKSARQVFRKSSHKSAFLATKNLVELLYANVSDLIAIIDRNQNHVWYNRAYAETLGYENKERGRRNPRVTIHPDDKERMRRVWERCVKTGKGRWAEYRIKTRGGGWIYLESQSQVVRDIPELGLCLVIVARDVTARKRREAEEQDAQRRIDRQNEAFIRLSRSEALREGDWDVSIRRILEVAGKTLGCVRVRLWWVDEQSYLVSKEKDVYTKGGKKEGERSVGWKIREGSAYLKRLRAGRLLKIEDVAKDKTFSSWNGGYFKKAKIGSVLQFPLYRKKQWTGVLAFEHKGAARRWAEDETNFAISMGDMILIMLEERDQREAYKALSRSQNKLAKELSQAASYVRSLLPPPLDGKVKVSWRFLSSTWLGGDAFGYHWIDKDHFALFLLDVCGHGVGAALFSMSAMNVLRSQTLPDTDFRDPAAVLNALSKTFPMEKHNNMFFTIWYGVYHRKTRELHCASAGHPPASLLTEVGGRRRMIGLGEPGLVIGPRMDTSYPVVSKTIRRGSVLYLYSDGIYEIEKKRGGTWSRQAFSRLLLKTPGEDEQALDFLVGHARQMQGREHFEDDCSLLKVTFT